MKILLDAGHGGSDPGAIGNGLQEKDITLDITLALTKELQSWQLTRTKDETVPLLARGANAPYADIYISIHCNSFINANPTGTEVWYPYKNEESEFLARHMLHHILTEFPTLKTRGVKAGHGSTWWYPFNSSARAVVLVETAFISNPDDAKLLQQTEDWAFALANGIESYASTSIHTSSKPIRAFPEQVKPMTPKPKLEYAAADSANFWLKSQWELLAQDAIQELNKIDTESQKVIALNNRYHKLSTDWHSERIKVTERG